MYLERRRISLLSSSLGNYNSEDVIVTETKNNVINSLTSHTLATDQRRNLPFNLNNLRSREGLLWDLKDKDNLLYEWKDWAVSTTIWPYWNNHVMLIYTWNSQEICHIWQISNTEMSEYYDILSQLLNWLEESYETWIESWELSLYYWLNSSLVPWWGKSQSVFRPHTHIVLINNNEKQEQFHKIEKMVIHDWEKNNKWMLALNKQNLELINNFEQYFLDLNSKKYKQSLFITEDDHYAIDFPLKWKFGDEETIELFEKVHLKWREFMDAIQRWDKWLINKETFSVLWNEIDKIGFSIWFYEEEWVSHLRFRFSFKNPWENAWVLEAMWHAINRDEKMGDILPDTSLIRWHVKRILSN